MEHRQGTRFRVSLPVSVRHGETDLGWFTTRDIGHGGMALNGYTDIELPRNSVVSLSIEVRKYNTIITETARAVVIHQDSGCIGLMWISRGVSLQRLILETTGLAAA